ncbi:hypothetical protein B0H14DRAFT_2567977 [Mycena olivaceomarginata]|nr:hypothetical protein B0H14DRAFT_2567977 [Mycena olivaceomarginata]
MNQVAARRTDKHFMYQKFKMQDLASPLIDSLLPSRPRDPRDTSQDRQDVEYISSCNLTRCLKMRIQWLLLAPPSQDIDTEFLKPLKNDGLDIFILIDCDTRWVQLRQNYLHYHIWKFPRKLGLCRLFACITSKPKGGGAGYYHKLVYKCSGIPLDTTPHSYDDVLGKFASRGHAKTVEDLLHAGWSPTHTARHGTELLAMLADYDTMFKADQAAVRKRPCK